MRFVTEKAFCSRKNSIKIYLKRSVEKYRDKMLGCQIGSFCIAIVSIQLITGVFRWIYQNFIGPNTSGKTTNFKEYGKWACM